MAIVFLLLAGIIVGAGIAGFILSRRWKSQIEEAQTAMKDIVAQHQQEVENTKALKQKVADLQFQLTQANNELRAFKK